MPGCMVRGDIILRTAFLNLLDNAFKYSPCNKVVEMSINRYELTVTVCITDQGHGIPSDQIEMVFSKMHRAPVPLAREMASDCIWSEALSSSMVAP